jgi:hypothetical protein
VETIKAHNQMEAEARMIPSSFGPARRMDQDLNHSEVARSYPATPDRGKKGESIAVIEISAGLSPLSQDSLFIR